MKLTDLQPAKGSKRGKKRVGRGWGSGLGKTGGRGYNGQGQRAGGGVRPGFEGGQMPLFRRLPKKKYFHVVNKVNYGIVNVKDLAKFDANTNINLSMLKEVGLVDKHAEALRVLGSGEISVSLNIEAAHFSGSAKEKIEAAGGKAVVLED